MSNIKLTGGAINTLMAGGEVDRPIFQILGTKKIAGQGGNDRYRLNISDGNVSHTFAMLATQLNYMVPDNIIHNFCVIQAEKVVANTVSNRRVLIILELTVLATGDELGHIKLGNPMPWLEGGANGTANPNQRPQQPAATNGRVPPSNAASSFAAPAARSAAIPSFGAPRPNNNNGYGNVKQEHPSQSFSGSIGSTIPINDINPYLNKGSAIKARVTAKSPIRTWSNAKGEGKVFNIDLLDTSGEIRMSGFTQAADAYYDMLKVGEVYMFKGFTVKSANKQYSTLNNDYELTLQSDSIIMPCDDGDANEVPSVCFNFVDIASIEGVENNKTVDIIGICKSRGEVQTFTSRNTNKEYTKRELVLVDRSNREINLTLWGEEAVNFLDDSNPVVCVKGAKVSDFGGKSVSAMNSSTIQINPDIPESHALRGWFDNEGCNQESVSLSVGRVGGNTAQWKILMEANLPDNPNVHDKGDYFMCKVTVMAIRRENAMYKACAQPTCNKKAIDTGNGMYRCEKCNLESPEFKWRAMLSVNFADFSDQVWATCFQESAEIILGHKAEDLGPMTESNDNAFDMLVKEVVFKPYIVKFRSKMETYNNESRMKTNVLELHPLNYSEYVKKLINEIKEESSG